MPQNTHIFENESSFEIRSPNNQVLARFSFQQLEDLVHYQIHLTLGNLESGYSERLPTYYGQGERILVYHGQDKRKAVEAAHGAACYLARRFDKDFDDLTNLADGEMVQTGGVLED